MLVTVSDCVPDSAAASVVLCLPAGCEVGDVLVGIFGLCIAGVDGRLRMAAAVDSSSCELCLWRSLFVLCSPFVFGLHSSSCCRSVAVGAGQFSQSGFRSSTAAAATAVVVIVTCELDVLTVFLGPESMHAATSVLAAAPDVCAITSGGSRSVNSLSCVYRPPC
jgi:hypothetical protein